MDNLHVLKLWMVQQWQEPVRPSRYITFNLSKKKLNGFIPTIKDHLLLPMMFLLPPFDQPNKNHSVFGRPTGLVQSLRNMLTLSWRKVPNFDPLLQIC